MVKPWAKMTEAESEEVQILSRVRSWEARRTNNHGVGRKGGPCGVLRAKLRKALKGYSVAYRHQRLLLSKLRTEGWSLDLPSRDVSEIKA